MTINLKVIREKYDTLFIDAIFQAPSRGLDDVINPVTGRAFADAQVGTLEDSEEGLAAARRAFDHGLWPHPDRNERR